MQPITEMCKRLAARAWSAAGARLRRCWCRLVAGAGLPRTRAGRRGAVGAGLAVHGALARAHPALGAAPAAGRARAQRTALPVHRRAACWNGKGLRRAAGDGRGPVSPLPRKPQAARPRPSDPHKTPRVYSRVFYGTMSYSEAHVNGAKTNKKRVLDYTASATRKT